MKKFAIILLALVVSAAMVLPAIAADNLSLSGQMRVRAWLIQDDTADTTDTTATGTSTGQQGRQSTSAAAAIKHQLATNSTRPATKSESPKP